VEFSTLRAWPRWDPALFSLESLQLQHPFEWNDGGWESFNTSSNLFFFLASQDLNVYVENNNILTTTVVAVETHMVQVQIPAAETSMIEDPSVLWMGLEQ